jgi:hypothetical protein
MHHLKLFVRDILDPRYLIVSDVSHYDDALPVANAALFVQLPGFDCAVQVPFIAGSGNTQALESLVLQVCPDEDVLEVLPDGLYTLTFSVAPNDQVQTVVYHYRFAQLKSRVFAEIAELHNQPDPHTVNGQGDIELDAKRRILLRAVLLMEALKANLCEPLDVRAAQNSYDEITKMLAAHKCL